MKKDEGMKTAPNVMVIPATKWSAHGDYIRSAKKLRVAAYCRVSTGDESQSTSYATQKEFYTWMIQEREEWEFAGIYADEAITGTSRVKRIQFNKMIQDALEGKLDYIVTKSISRFARNTLDTLNCVRQLRRLTPPVGIYFEKENIDTLDAKGELILTILSALAQEESRSISDNIRWTFQKKFQEGKPQINLKRMLGYDYGPGGSWMIAQEEADIVRYIFDSFIHGATGNQIAMELNRMEKKTAHGNIWRSDGVYGILRNEKYVGDLEMQKTVTKDFLTHKSVLNRGEAPRYYIKNHHEAIISREDWEKAQAMLNAGDKKGPKRSPFYHLTCGYCGKPLRRMAYSQTRQGKRSSYPVWVCPDRCGSPVREEAIKLSFMETLKAAEIPEDAPELFKRCIKAWDGSVSRFDRGLYQTFIVQGELIGDVIRYRTYFGMILESHGNLRKLDGMSEKDRFTNGEE